MANSGTNLQADILKVGHHGSATSSSSAFLSKVHPRTSVIEVGAGNSYGHPTSATYGRLAQVGSAVYRTDLDGDVTVTTEGTTYNVKKKQPIAATAKIVTTQQAVGSQSLVGAVCDCSTTDTTARIFPGMLLPRPAMITVNRRSERSDRRAVLSLWMQRLLGKPGAIRRVMKEGGFGDAIIYATAQTHKGDVLTGEPNFRNLSGVVYIGKD